MKPRLFSASLFLLLTSLLHLQVVLADDGGASGGVKHPMGAGTYEGRTHSQLLSEANLYLTTRRYNEALSSLDAALHLDPTHYLTYYRRATALLSLGRTGSALSDLDKLLELNPKFSNAWIQKAKIQCKEGELDKAQESVTQYKKIGGSSSSGSASASGGEAEGDKIASDIQRALTAQSRMTTAFDAASSATSKHLKKGSKEGSGLAEQIMADKILQQKAQQCAEEATTLLEVSPSHLRARRSRADCKLWQGELDDAMADWSRISHLSPSPTLQLRLSALSFYLQNDLPAARQHLKACLNSDPDNKQCARAHRKLKNYEKVFKKLDNFKESGEWRAVLSVLKGAKVGGKSVKEELEQYIKEELMQVPEQQGNNSITDEEPVISPILSDAISRSQLLHSLTKDTCKAYVHLDEITRAKPFCDAVLQRDPDDPDALVARGEQAMKEERYDEAVRDFSTAFQKSGNQDRGIHARLTKAQKRQKLANTKDYYKVLGVSRDADQRTIKKAYRTLARQHHPDKGGTQEKMAQINEAFGVLGDDELRKKYDMGDDPNDPMAQAGQGGYGNPFMFQGGMPFGQAGGHPFAQFFQQQGGGGGGGHFKQQGGGQQFHFQFGG